VKHILVTTDFSELADRAITPAADLGARLGAKLTIAHVLTSDKPPKADPDAPYYKVARQLYEADAELEAQCLKNLQERAAGLEGVDCDVALARGGAVEGIVALVKERGIDLVVTGSQGRTGLSRIFLGSVAEQLARELPVPVLIWKEPERRRTREA